MTASQQLAALEFTWASHNIRIDAGLVLYEANRFPVVLHRLISLLIPSSIALHQLRSITLLPDRICWGNRCFGLV